MLPLLLLFLWLPSQTQNCGCEAKPLINTLAVVNGIQITQRDLSIDAQTQVGLVQDTVIAARSQEVRLQINKILLTAEAKRRGVTLEKLFELEVASKIPPPTDADIRAFYERNKNRLTKDYKAIKNNLAASLRTELETVRATEFANGLRAGAQITVSELPVTPPANEEDLARVYATINGVNITSRDIEQSLLPIIFRVQQQVYAFRKQDLDLKINDILLEQEARRLSMSPQSLINHNVKVRVPIVTVEQARAYYNENKQSLQGDFSDLKMPIMQYLIEQEERRLFLAYAEQLRKGAAVQIYLTPPGAPTL